MYRDQDGLPLRREEGDATPPRRRSVRPDPERNSGRGYRQSSQSGQGSRRRVLDSYHRPAASSRDEQVRPRNSRAPSNASGRVWEEEDDRQDRYDRFDRQDRRERSDGRDRRAGTDSERARDDSRDRRDRRAAPGRSGRQWEEEDRYDRGELRDRRPAPRNDGRLWDEEEEQTWRDQSTWQPAMGYSETPRPQVVPTVPTAGTDSVE